jgi:hypothetical protein
MTSRDNEGNETLTVTGKPQAPGAQEKIHLINTAINSMMLLAQTESDPLDREYFSEMAKWCQLKLKTMLERN